MEATIGRIVHYTLSAGDCGEIERKHGVNDGHNPVSVGQVFPAMIVRVWSPGSDTVQLQVFIDGDFTMWGSSRHGGGEPTEGRWHWPDA